MYSSSNIGYKKFQSQRNIMESSLNVNIFSKNNNNY